MNLRTKTRRGSCGLFLVLIGALSFGLVELHKSGQRRIKQEYVVVYYPKNGPIQTFDGAQKLHYGRGFVRFVHLNKTVELRGDVSITKK